MIRTIEALKDQLELVKGFLVIMKDKYALQLIQI
jgi:hypothetical protein